MKRLTALLTIALFVFGCREYEKVTETETFSIPDTFAILYIDVPAGSIDINSSTDNGSGSTDIELSAEKFAYGCTDTAARDILEEIEIETDLDGDTYRVIVRVPDSDSARGPEAFGGANLTFNNVNAKEVTIMAAAGNISCDDITGGRINAAAGTIEIGRTRGAVDIDAAAGVITVERAEGDFTVNAGAGNVSLNAAGEGPRDGSITAGAGNIDLTLSSDLSCTVDLAVVAGAVDITGVTEFDDLVSVGGIDIEARFTLNEGEGRIAAQTAAGSITVAVQ